MVLKATFWYDSRKFLSYRNLKYTKLIQHERWFIPDD